MKKFFVLLVVVSAGLFLLAWMNIRKTVNTPVGALPFPAEYAALGPINVSFAASDGIKLEGWYFKVPDPKGVVIVMHGLSESVGGKGGMVRHAKLLTDAGYSAFLFDFRGFGESEFAKISLGTQEWKDAHAAYEEVKKYPENTGKPVGFLGYSMGGATAIITAGRTHGADFVIADVPYASAPKFLRKQTEVRGLAVIYPFVNLAARVELGSEYTSISPEEYVDKISVPLLIIGAKRDMVVDPHDARALYEKATSPGKKLWMAETSHHAYNDAPKDYEYQVLTFLNSVTQGFKLQ